LPDILIIDKMISSKNDYAMKIIKFYTSVWKEKNHYLGGNSYKNTVFHLYEIPAMSFF